MTRRLRFHWSLSAAGDPLRAARPRAEQSGIPDIGAHVEFCRLAERSGIESLLTAYGFHRPDPIVLATALGGRTESVAFMVAVRSGVFAPTAYVQQVNTLAALTGGRVCLNVVIGHTPEEQHYYGDFLAHDERFERTDEFLTVCRALWESDAPVCFRGVYYRVEGARLNTPFTARTRSSPEIYLGGSSPAAIRLAVKHADCLLTLPDHPTALAERVRPVIDGGREVGVLVSLVTRPTRAEALAATRDLLAAVSDRARKTHREFSARSDSVTFNSVIEQAESQDAWVTPTLWRGAVPFLGAPSIALVGDYDEVTDAIWQYRDVGVSQFLFLGWPDQDEMRRFSEHVLPRVRRREGIMAAGSTVPTADFPDLVRKAESPAEG
jgi:alkanesulfonate monooxygenase